MRWNVIVINKEQQQQKQTREEKWRIETNPKQIKMKQSYANQANTEHSLTN